MGFAQLVPEGYVLFVIRIPILWIKDAQLMTWIFKKPEFHSKSAFQTLKNIKA